MSRSAPAADRARWRTVWAALGLDPPAAELALLQQRYREPHRRYHTLRHLEACLGWLDRARGETAHPAEVELALWFHDAIYDPRSPENEEASAAWARSTLRAAGAPEPVARRIHDLVLATRHDAQARGRDAQLVVDIDLAILGADTTEFDAYEVAIREEYRHVPAARFRQGRAHVLAGFLARPHIYATRFFRERLEARARANLTRSLARLGAGRR